MSKPNYQSLIDSRLSLERLEERTLLTAVSIPPNVPWIDTGIDVIAGELVRISTTGALFSDLDNVAAGLNADGYVAPFNSPGGGYSLRVNPAESIAPDGSSTCEMLGISSQRHPITVCMALIGKVGGRANDALGTPLVDDDPETGDGFIGSNYEGAAPVGGRLFLGVNNPLWRRSDNLTGAFEATVRTEIANLTADWSDTQNPHLHWTFNSGTKPLIGLDQWRGADQAVWTTEGADQQIGPAWLKLTNLPLEGFSPGDVVVRPTAVRSGFGAANATWTSPEDAFVSISGRLWTAATGDADVGWTLDVNGNELTTGTLLAGEFARDKPFELRLGSGGPGAVQNVFVEQGDELRLTITSAQNEFVGVDVTITSDVRDYPGYELGEIPDQDASDGEPINFFVDAPNGSEDQLSMRVNGSPNGDISLDASSGLFSYTPAATDRFDFTVLFQLGDGTTNSELQQVTFRTNRLSPELELVSTARPLPDPASNAYLTITEQDLPPVFFNRMERATRSVEISGKLVNLIPDDPNGLFERFGYADENEISGVNADIQELSVYAETVVIGGELRLPGTNVAIFAKELVFHDADDHVGRINTTPLRYTTAALPSVNGRPGEDGKPGQDAGDLTLNVGSLHLPQGAVSETRFILRGGAGQAAGEGVPGADGTSQHVVRHTDVENALIQDWVLQVLGEFPAATYIEFQLANSPFATVGSMRFPTDGEDAIAGGRPGQGGDGGRLTSGVLQLEAIAELSGGAAGRPAQSLHGGQAGSPRVASQVIVPLNPFAPIRPADGWSVTQRQQNDGAGWNALSAEVGTDGTTVSLDDQGASTWLHPSALRAMITHAKDVYLNGHHGIATELFSQYGNLLAGAVVAAPEFASQIAELRAEVTTLEHQLANRLDYFGNPPGWAPTLSFAANFRAFQNEIDSDVRTLYLSRLIQQSALDQASRHASLSNLIVELDVGVAEAIDSVNDAQTALPDLQTQLENIANETSAIQERLADKEQELAELAEANVNRRAFFKDALEFLGGILSVAPIPVVSGIGMGLNAVNSFVSDPSISGLVGAVKGITDPFKKATLDASSAAIAEQLTLLTPPSKATSQELKDFAGRLGQLGSEWGPVVNAYQEVTAATQVPMDEIALELEVLKSQDPTFNELVDEVEALLAKKEVFAIELTRTINSLSNGLNRLNADYAAADALNRARSEVSQRLSHDMLSRVQDMERKARDRLLRYQYNMAKSFEYEMLLPYTGDLALGHLFAEIIRLLSPQINADETWLDDPSNFETLKSIYESDLRDTADQIWTKLNSNAPQRTSEIKFRLSPEQLLELNHQGEVTINLIEMGFINPTRQDVKLLQFGVDGLSADLTGPFAQIANVRFEFEHAGVSIVQSEGQRYAFQHISTGDEGGFFWATDYDAIGGELTQSEVSPSDIATVAALLNLNPGGLSSDQEGRLYAHPGAWADVTIRQETVVVPRSVNVDLQELSLFVKFDSNRSDADDVVLDVRTPEDLSPRVLVSEPDGTGRDDGEGSFTRFYSRGQEVLLTAAPVYGGYQFSAWRNDRGEVIGSEPTLALTLDENVQVHTLYQETPRPQSLLPGDADGDFDFDQLDLVQVLQSAKYLTGEPATWSDGDWNADGVFDPQDIVAALQTGNYLQGPYAAHSGSLVKNADQSLIVVDSLFAGVILDHTRG